jgi:glycosyltransferase involved in cell wall biosynthesis
MRLCFYNPHAISNTLGETVLSKLAQIFGANKANLKKHNQRHDFLLNFLRDKKYNSAIVVDGGGTSFSPLLNQVSVLRNRYYLNKFISFGEIYIWCLLNNINPLKQKIIFNKNKLDAERDVLFSYAFYGDVFSCEKLVEKSIIKKFTGKKILHATHLQFSTKKVSNNVKKAEVRHMIAEADLKKSSYFNKFFYFIDNVYILPHVLREKYIKIKNFSERKNRCLALGTLIISKEIDESIKDHFDFFQINTFHLMRKKLFENKIQLEDFVDCLINFHNEKIIEITNKSKFYKKYNIFRIIYNLFFMSEGKEYHNMDIVEKYNEYKMFISPEENVGLPSVNFVEGMACGCAYIGLDHSMYTDAGMIDKKHYIAYNGTMEDLKNKISYYQSHQDELDEIATNGYNLAKNRFSKERVQNDFWAYLGNLSRSV